MPCVTASDLFSEKCFLCAVLTCCIVLFWGYFYLFIYFNFVGRGIVEFIGW